jgi:hypothetical protein
MYNSKELLKGTFVVFLVAARFRSRFNLDTDCSHDEFLPKKEFSAKLSVV